MPECMVNKFEIDIDLTMSQPYPKPGNRPPNTIAKRFPNPNLSPKFCIAELFSP